MTVDAMHAQQAAACCITECGTDYVMTAVKENQPTMLVDLQSIDWTTAERFKQDVELGPSRLEHHRCEVVDLSGAEWDGYGALPSRRQAFRIERSREIIKIEKVERKTAYGLISLSAAQTSGLRPRNRAKLTADGICSQPGPGHRHSIAFRTVLHQPMTLC